MVLYKILSILSLQSHFPLLTIASMIRSLIDRFYPNTNSLGHRITILGLPYSGKTTFLYLLQSGEIVRTIPSIGFNVETVHVKTASGKSFKMTGWDIGTSSDSASLYGLVRFYTFSTEAIIWIVDASDRNTLQESVDRLTHILSGADQDRINISNSKIFPILM